MATHARSAADGWPTQQYHSSTDDLKDDGSPYGQVMTRVYMDMTRPLSQYYISAGHNSYLEGNQLTGKSSVATIKRALLLGCRVLELDCWSPKCGCGCASKRDVVVTHGGTLTSNVTFTECCEAIRDFAFATSAFPVIVSLELHVTDDWGDHMARVAVEVFGEMLHRPPPADAPDAVEFPSPASLQGQVLLRAGSDDCSPELAELVTVRKIKGREMEEAMADADAISAMPASSVSFVEKKMDEMMAHDPDNAGSVKAWRERLHRFREMAHRHLVRVYPDGIRVNSSNYCPWAMWFAGASFATLNWQVWDRDVMTNLAFFRDNGACGYILKPVWIRDDVAVEPRWTRLVAMPFGYRSGERRRTGRVQLRLNVHGTWENFQRPHVESAPRVVGSLKVKHGRDHVLKGAAPHRVVVAPEIACLTIWVEHLSCDGIVVVPLHTLRPGRWWFPVLSRQGRVNRDQTRNDWLAMDLHFEDVMHPAHG